MQKAGFLTTRLIIFFILQTVADLGSEVTVMKSQVDSITQFVKSAETKLEELPNKATNVTVMNKPFISIVF